MNRARLLALLILLTTACQPDHFQPKQESTLIPKASPTSSLMRTGYVWRNGLPQQVFFSVSDGHAIVGGDISIGLANEIAPSREALLRTGVPQLGVAIDQLYKRWPNGTVPFVIHSGFPDSAAVTSAMTIITARAYGITFVPKQSYHSDYIQFEATTDPGICAWSYLGKKGGKQEIKARAHADCASTPGVLAHELLHALGLYHEHQRCDRDSYVTIYSDSIDVSHLDWWEIAEYKEENWGKQCADETDYAGYNQWSIMHYDATQGGWDHGSTKALVILGGQYNRDSLTLTDGTTLNLIYPPAVVQWGVVTNQSGSPLFTWAPRPNATGYSIDFVIEYTYNDDLNSTQDIWDMSITGVGSTSDTSFVDTGFSYTGNSNCEYYRDTYSTIFYNYYYEIRAWYPGGVSGLPRRFPAPVGSYSYPCDPP